MISLFALVIVVIVLSISGSGIRKKVIGNRRSELLHEQKTNAGLIQVQMMPFTIFHPDYRKCGSKYVLQIKLKVTHSLQQERLIQYMNFGIGRYFFAIQAGDTLLQTACERIPGIDRNEFVYMTCFDKLPTISDSSLLICIADATAGFGNNIFEFKSKVLRKLQQ